MTSSRVLRFATLAVSLFTIVARASAQGNAPAQSNPPALGSIRTPPSPAFTVLGIEPSAVERPTTPADAALSFVNKFRNDTLPKDYAFEASPYWLVGHPDLSWQNDATRNPAQSIARTFSLSVATAQTGKTDSPVTSLGIGIRTLVASGQMTQKTRDALNQLSATLSETGAVFLRLVGEAGLDRLDQQLVTGMITKEEYEQQKQQLAQVVIESDAYKKVMARAKDVAAKREGFFLEVAAGFMWDFRDGKWAAQQFKKRAIWATPSYETGPWAVLGVARFVDETAATNENAVDWGGRIIYSTADYGLSVEYVERQPIDSGSTVKRSHRFVGIGEYHVSPATWIIASFGKDRQKLGTNDTLVAQLGLAFSFSKDRYKFD